MAKDAEVAKEIKAEMKQKAKEEEKKKEAAEAKKEEAKPVAVAAKKEAAKEIKAEKKEEAKAAKKEAAEAKKEEAPLEERKYVFSLRDAWKAPRPDRTRAAIRTLRNQLHTHLKKEIKLDVSVNKKIWQKGMTNPPRKIKVNAKIFKDHARIFAID